MKFSLKVVCSIIVTVVLAFAIGGTLMLVFNYKSLLSNVIEQSLIAHKMTKDTIETQLLSDKIDLEAFTKKKFAEHMERASDAAKGCILVVKNMKGETIYSNTSLTFSSPSLKEYEIREINEQKWVVVKTILQHTDEDYYLISAHNISSVYVEREQQYGLFLVIASFMSIIAAATAWLTAHFLTKNIRILHSVSAKIAEGNYEAKANLTVNDEIGELSRCFDNMVGTLRDEMERKTAFVADFSHELKTPMTSMIGYSDILRSRTCTENEKFMYADAIYRNCRRLEQLSSKMMELLGLSENRISIVPTKTRSLKNKFKRLAFDKRMVENEFENSCILIDEDLIITLLKNLTDNAIKASPVGNKVQVIGKKTNKGYLISVIDNGKGMTAEQIAHATDPFYKADKSRSSQGSGLGLSICKKICDFHGAELIIESEFSKGTTVSCMLEIVDDEE